MADLSGFNANEVEPNAGFQPMPRGDYRAVIIASEKKSSKNNNKYLNLQVQIAAGEFQNRTLFDILNIEHPDPKTRQIALGTLSAICRAVGVLTPKDSSELHMKPLLVTVGIQNDPQYGMQNKIKGYKPIGAGPVPPSAPASAPVGAGSPVPAGGNSKSPW